MDVICLGELLVDMFPAELGRYLGDVTAFHPKPGGAPANVAVCLARLGIESAFIGKVGDDAFGHHLAAVMAREGVETKGIRFDEEARTTLAFIARPDPNHAEFLFYRNPGADARFQAGDLDLEMLSDTRIFHFGSLSLVEDPILSALLLALKTVVEAGAMVSMDVNYRPSLWENPAAARDAIMAIIPSVNMLKVNDDELKLLSGSSDVETGSQRLLEAGPEIIIITMGEDGSYFRTKAGFGHVAAFQVETVDSTGCGDAFIAGVLARMIELLDGRQRLFEAQMLSILRFANAVGAITATREGVIPALPTRDEVMDFLAVN